MQWRLIALTIAVLTGVLFAACGGGGSNTSTSGRIPFTCEAIREISSYRYTIHVQLDIPEAPAADGTPSEDYGLGAFAPALFGLLHDLEIEGAFVAPDRSQAVLQAGTDEVEIRSVSGKSWVRYGDVWRDEGASDRELLLSPDTICSEMVPGLGQALAGLKYKTKIINGITTHHYHLDETDTRRLAGLLDSPNSEGDLPKRFILDIWLAEDGGWPVQVQLTVVDEDENDRPTAVNVSMKFWDINSRDIEIEPPETVRQT